MSTLAERLRKAFWDEDKAKNQGKLHAAYSEILDINSNRNGETEDVVKNKLYDLLKHAVDTTAYYAEIIGNREIELYNFPVINKIDVMDNRDKILSSAYLGSPLHEMHTSGSTGIPFYVQQDQRKRMRVIAEIKAMNEIAGYPSHEKMLYIFGAGPTAKYHSIEQQQRENIYRIQVVRHDDESMKMLADFLVNEHPVALHAFASELPPLISYIKKHDIKPSDMSIRTVITGGMFVPVELREETEAVFGPQCRVHAKYSNEELGIMAMDEGANTPYILNVADYHFEILKMDVDEPCGYGEMGRVVVTDLYNYALPLIRYDTGDVAVMAERPGKWPVFETIHGRKRDLIYAPDGTPISANAMTDTLRYVKNVHQYQLIQDGKDTYTFKIVPATDKSAVDEETITNTLHGLIGEDAKIHIGYTDAELVSSSQKRVYMVNNWRK